MITAHYFNLIPNKINNFGAIPRTFLFISSSNSEQARRRPESHGYLIFHNTHTSTQGRRERGNAQEPVVAV